jgi:Actinobacteria/chloroflexi VLRF1 release factor
VKNVVGSGGKWLDVSADRLPGWIASFAVRHGVSGATGQSGETLAVALADGYVAFTATDGSVAQCYPPFPPAGGLAALVGRAAIPRTIDDQTNFDNPAVFDNPTVFDINPTEFADPAVVAEALAAHARRPRTVGVLLVRLGGYAAGVFTGYPPVLGDAKVGSRPVHGRSAAGGWSQHRFARRREKQANEALSAAADAAVMIFGGGAGTGKGGAGGRPRPRATRLDAVVLGGDRRAVADLRDDPRLAPYFGLATERFLTVPDPKRAVLLEAAKQFTAVRIWLTET